MKLVMSTIAFAMLATPGAAQEFGLHGATALPRYPDQHAAYGAGVSLTSFGLGEILADTGVRRRVNGRLGARIAFTELRSRELWTPLCADFCPLASFVATRETVELRIIEGSLLVTPYRTTSMRVEAGAGVASYAYHVFSSMSSRRQGTWGFTASAGIGRRLGASPVWLTAGYERRAVSPIEPPADGASVQPPPHSIHLGVMYRVADR